VLEQVVLSGHSCFDPNIWLATRGLHRVGPTLGDRAMHIMRESTFATATCTVFVSLFLHPLGSSPSAGLDHLHTKKVTLITNTTLEKQTEKKEWEVEQNEFDL